MKKLNKMKKLSKILWEIMIENKNNWDKGHSILSKWVQFLEGGSIPDLLSQNLHFNKKLSEMSLDQHLDLHNFN